MTETTGDKHPLIVDLDKTFLRTDTLLEAISYAASHTPKALLQSIPLLLKSRLAFKNYLAPQSVIGAGMYPVDADVLALVKEARAQGREVWLATASPRPVADAVVIAQPVFDGILASDANINLKSGAKANALIGQFGRKGFDYIGDSQADVAIWENAHTAIVAGSASPKVRRLAKDCNNICICLPEHRATIKDWLNVFRVKQWVKNLLVFVPMILAHAFDVQTIMTCILAFLSISFCASSIYVLNDSLDVHSDRQHERKKNRPFAAGRVPLVLAPIAFVVPLLLSSLLALFLPMSFMICLSMYFVGTVAYSFVFKKAIFLDVIVLAGLYVLRVIAGGYAFGGGVSNWLLAFAGFMFLGLALLKRSGAILLEEQAGKLAGRAYLTTDRSILEIMATCSGFAAFVVVAMYVDSLKSAQLYRNSSYLWLLCPVLVYWYGRILLLVHRGCVGDDPVSYSIHDKSSYVSLSIILFLLFMAL